MSFGFSTAANLSIPVSQALVDMHISIPTPYFIYPVGASVVHHAMHAGNTARFAVPQPVDPPIRPMDAEGVIDPPAQQLNRSFIDAKVSYYTTSVALGTLNMMESQDNLREMAVKVLGRARKQAEDIILRDYLMSVVNVYNCRHGVNGDVPTEFTNTDISITNAVLAGANAEMIMGGVRGENRIGTGPVRDSYIYLSNTDLIPDYNALPDFQYKYNYPNPNETLSSEYGAVQNSRHLVSSQAAVQRGASELGNDVYNVIGYGKEGYANIRQDGMSGQLIIHPASITGSNAELYETVAVKFGMAPVILHETYMINMRCTRRYGRF